jgi:hypothetical protein
MPTDLSTLNLGQTVTESGFFNDTAEEQALVTQIQAAGHGFFKLKQLKTGAFVEATKVTEIAEDTFTTESDRVIVDADPEFIYMYVNLVQIAAPTPPV